jgi:pyrroline-5-carboxylate reductase
MAEAETQSLLVVGGGKMGEALVTGLIRTAWAPPGAITVVEMDPARRAELASAQPGIRVVAGVAEALTGGSEAPNGAVIAVKPPDVKSVCETLGAVAIPRVLSIAAGVTLVSLESWLAAGRPAAGGGAGVDPPAVVRAMPNTPALVGAGAAAIAGGTTARPPDLDWARGILSAVGAVVTVYEPALDAVTGLSGSGPAYVFLVAEALIDAGVLVGLTRPVARQLAVQTLLGSARLLDETADEPATLRAAVTSPGGTTAAGLRALEAGGVRSAVLDAVVAATERSRELGRPG